MSNLVNLKLPKKSSIARKDDRFIQKNYSQSAPFFENPNGLLIHRIKSLYSLKADYYDEPWLIVEYWCGNYGRTNMNDDGLLFDPGTKLVCARCETTAIANKEQTSSQLAKRHICIGVCKPINVCKLHS